MKGRTKSGGQKHVLDKFYTKPEIAAECLALLDLTAYDLIVEPSAGGGSFSRQIPGCVALDLHPEDDQVMQQDFFDYTPPGDAEKILVVGNPPFGQQSSLAVRFINQAATFADTVAFIVPRSFNKSSVQSRIDPFLHLRFSVVLSPAAFTFHGADYAVPCVFQVWERKSVARPVVISSTISDVVEFVKPDGNPDFTIRRVGGNAGKASMKLDVSAQSNYFVRNTSTMGTSDLVDFINGLHFPSRDDSVGPRSLSKRELVQILDAQYKAQETTL